MKGAKPKPKNVRLAEGTFRPDLHSDKMSDVVQCTDFDEKYTPDHLSEPVKKIFQDYAKMLSNANLFYVEHIPHLESWAFNVNLMRELQKEIDERGKWIIDPNSGTRKPNPAIKMWNDASSISLKYSQIFGFSPTDMERVKLSQPKKEEVKDTYYELTD